MIDLSNPSEKGNRIAIIGAGFGGFTLAKKLSKTDYEIVLIDRNNYHQFQPLFYQVAMAGLEPSSIVYPLRKAFQKASNVMIRAVEVEGIDVQEKLIQTDKGKIAFDKLVVATGATTNYFGNEELGDNCFGLKSVSEALSLRNYIFHDLESALTTFDYDERQFLIDIAIVGGGPTGVELAGALAEMKKYILPKDYKELKTEEIDIYLIQSGDRLLDGMSDNAAQSAEKFLSDLGVKIMLNTRVTGYNDGFLDTLDGQKVKANKVIWAAGIHSPKLNGIEDKNYGQRGRLLVNDQLEVINLKDVYAIGDASIQLTEKYEKGHPQVAQVAIQMANHLAKNFKSDKNKAFKYRDLGSMATIGRNKAVVDLPKFKFSGFFAWILWLFIHLTSLIGFKNKIFVLINWMWNYITYDQSLRLIIKPHKRPNSGKKTV